MNSNWKLFKKTWSKNIDHKDLQFKEFDEYIESNILENCEYIADIKKIKIDNNKIGNINKKKDTLYIHQSPLLIKYKQRRVPSALLMEHIIHLIINTIKKKSPHTVVVIRNISGDDDDDDDSGDDDNDDSMHFHKRF